MHSKRPQAESAGAVESICGERRGGLREGLAPYAARGLGHERPILSVALKPWRIVRCLHEYEGILKAYAAELGLSLADIDTLLDAICARAEEWQLTPGWIPVLLDPDDEPLVQLAYDSAARRIITHNVRHLAPARALGIEVLPPREFAAMIPAP